MDIEKQPAPAPEAAPIKEEPLVHTLLLQIKDTLTQLDKAVINKETRTISRITKNVRKYRNVIQGHHLAALYESLGFQLPQSIKRSQGYNSDFTQKLELNRNLATRIAKTLQLQAFVRIFVVQILWRDGNYGQCLRQVEELLNRLTLANKRNLDNYTAALYHFYARLHQKNNTDQSIREHLLEALNRASVRSDQIGQSTIFNLILRNYIKYNHLEAAFNLIEKCSFPEGKSNNEFCKYLFNTGRIKAVRRQYAQALEMLNQALRKSPDVAKGFKIQCQKIAIVVELLLGDIPNRQIFSDEFIFSNLFPYFRLIQVVLQGELQIFNNLVQQYKDRFQKDGLYIIILRLNQIVIRIGLRRISLAYSNISLRDVAAKLNIPAEDVEFVVAKALRDNIIHGQIDHQRQILKVEKEQNIYVTHEPQAHLDKRIKYCLGLYHEIQKAITYPDMKMNLGESKEQQLDASQLMNLLDFDDEI